MLFLLIAPVIAVILLNGVPIDHATIIDNVQSLDISQATVQELSCLQENWLTNRQLEAIFFTPRWDLSRFWSSLSPTLRAAYHARLMYLEFGQYSTCFLSSPQPDLIALIRAHLLPPVLRVYALSWNTADLEQFGVFDEASMKDFIDSISVSE